MARHFGAQSSVQKPAPSGRIPAWAWGALACLVTLIVFLPALRFPFFPFWDDDIHVHANPLIAHLGWSSIAAFWSGPWQQLYIPLTYSAWAGLAAVSRWWSGLPAASGALNAAWFHGANVVVHAISTALVFVLLRRVAEKFAPKAGEGRVAAAAALGALLFALHPLQVEPVAWVSGFRDVLGGCLGLASLVVLFGGKKTQLARWLCATLLFALSLAAKPGGVALPLVAAILAVMPFGWKTPRLIRELGPWIVIGALWVVLTSHAQWAAAMASDLAPAWMRPLVAGDALAFYSSKVLWPAGLCADYGRSPNAAREAGWLWWTWLGPVAGVAILAAVRRLRIYLVPAGVFAAALLPMLGLVPFNFQIVSTVADRYAYLAMLGPAMALAMFAARSSRAWIPAAAALPVAAFATLTVIRLPLWSEDIKLFADTLRVHPTSWKAMHNLASALDDRGQTSEAAALMRNVIILRPDSAEAVNDFSVMLWKLGNREEAVQAMRQALDIRATASEAKNLATMEAGLGNQAGQVAALRRAMELDPADLQRAAQLAWVLATSQDEQLRNGQEALGLAQRIINAGEITVPAVSILVAALAETGQWDAAKKHAHDLVQQLEAAGDPQAQTIRRVILEPIEAGKPVRSNPQ